MWTAVLPLLFAQAALPAPQELDSRPVVLVLHGRGIESRDSTVLRKDWRDALNLGLSAAGAEPLIEEADLRLVWYADALDPRAPVACAAPGNRPSSELASGMAAAGALLGLAAEWLGGPEAAALRSLGGDLLYLGDPEKRCAAGDRLARALAEAAAEGRPIVLVAHSFGALVSYHHLRTREASMPRVERYVTIGSLLGRRELRQLLFGAVGREPDLPAGVGSWVNVRDPDDPFASPLVGVNPESGGKVQDVRTEKSLPGDPHDAARYLADPATARAVLGAWCAALPDGGKSERSCSVSVLDATVGPRGPSASGR